jgi:hypothetical protein
MIALWVQDPAARHEEMITLFLVIAPSRARRKTSTGKCFPFRVRREDSDGSSFGRFEGQIERGSPAALERRVLFVGKDVQMGSPLQRRGAG